MATTSTPTPVSSTTPIAIKVLFEGRNRRLKLPMGDLGPTKLPEKLRAALNIPAGAPVVFERFSDSSQSYIRLDSNYPTAYKSLLRAAKAKLKLRLRATMPAETLDHSDRSGHSAASATDLLPDSPAAESAPASSSPNSDPIPTANPSETTLIEQFNTILSGLSSTPKPTEPAKPAAPVTLEALVGEGQAPVPQPFSADLAQSNKKEKYPIDPEYLKEESPEELERGQDCKWAPACNWTVYCNWCDKSMAGEHYHCSICDDGDYDLCNACVGAGVHCPGEGHWLIKRIIKNGIPLNSTTERVAPAASKSKATDVRPTKPVEKPQAEVKKAPEIKEKAAVQPASEKTPLQTMPGAYQEEKKWESPFAVKFPSRTCNSCVRVFPDENFVHCTTCEDFDLCFPCLRAGKHGHHPAHGFVNVSPKTTVKISDKILCRSATHSAICDGCDQYIHGVRHKCLNCPDWDYCDTCVKSSKQIHPGHRFVPIYDPLPEPRTIPVSHYGIFCDGPLCNDKPGQKYIRGVRFKCAICHDTDFCANCEASPVNKHNRTHPLIMLKTPVQNVSVTTMGENRDGSSATMGDNKPCAPSPVQSEVSKVVTIADVKPTEVPLAPRSPPKEKIEIKDLLTEPIKEKIKIQDLLSANPVEQPAEPGPSAPIAIPAPPTVPAAKSTPVRVAGATPGGTVTQYGELNAHFLQDLITDGSKMAAGRKFLQVWTILNAGPTRWPAGCRVQFVGGDHMLAMEDEDPFSVQNHEQTAESNATIAPVEVGQKFAFRVEMKAPKRKGAAISYWRLKTPDGTPFGHRLWCHIHVVDETPEPKSIAEHAPPQLSKRASFPVRLDGSPYGYASEFQGQVPPPPPPPVPPMNYPAYPSFAPPPFPPPPPAAPYSRDQYNLMLSQQQRLMALRQVQMAREIAARQQNHPNLVAGRTPPAVPEKTPLTETSPPPPPPSAPSATADARQASIRTALHDYAVQLDTLRQRFEATHGKTKAEEPTRLTREGGAARQFPREPAPISNPAPADGSPPRAAGNSGVHMLVPEAPAFPKGKEAMIFPVLQKDGSPSSSVHAATESPATAAPATASSSATETATSAAASPANPLAARVDDADDELFDDADSLTAELVDGDDSDASGFLTDEEYEILDASDEEVL